MKIKNLDPVYVKLVLRILVKYLTFFSITSISSAERLQTFLGNSLPNPRLAKGFLVLSAGLGSGVFGLLQRVAVLDEALFAVEG